MGFLWNRKYLPIIAYVILATAVVFAFRQDQKHTDETFAAIEAARMERVANLNQINKEQCQEIEELKRQFREEAVEDFQNLRQTLELLEVPYSQRLEDEARAEKEQTQMRFVEGTCPRRKIQ